MLGNAMPENTDPVAQNFGLHEAVFRDPALDRLATPFVHRKHFIASGTALGMGPSELPLR